MGAQPRIVLITGGGSGLGLALARAFKRQGDRVVIAGRNAEKLETAAGELAAFERGEVLALPCDVTARRQVHELAQSIRARWGEVQVLVNNAGVAKAAGFLEMPDTFWDEILTTNLTGAYNCCKAFMPAMIEARWGRIINIGSTASKVGYPQVSAYVSSKHGLLGLTRALALETARLGITVNMICPGYLDDELTHENARRMAERTGKSSEQILAMFAASAPQQRLIAPDEVGAFALLLASDTMAGITGQAISIDGGATMT
jgi:NAD(P)-dependent dehydrogenase (short-subunit alcohol dehydrogenase family)